MTAASEILVIDPDPEWSARLRVVATAPPRVVVFQDPGDLDEVPELGRLTMVRGTGGTTRLHGDSGVVEELDAGARLFVEAWRAWAGDKSARPGEGLPWDSAGFEPPDRPPQ
jgi:hypothetical protein